VIRGLRAQTPGYNRNVVCTQAVGFSDMLCTMDEHPKHDSMRDVESTHQEMLFRSAVESDRKFWSGERPISAVQWVGLLLMFVAIIGVVASSNYRAIIALFGAIALAVVLGNRRARRKAHHPEKD